MIGIYNKGKSLLPEYSSYQVQINDRYICEFDRKRSEGLATCLRKAADAVEKAEMNRLLQVYDELNKYSVKSKTQME